LIPEIYSIFNIYYPKFSLKVQSSGYSGLSSVFMPGVNRNDRTLTPHHHPGSKHLHHATCELITLLYQQHLIFATRPLLCMAQHRLVLHDITPAVNLGTCLAD
jgi:hypothetical protein